VNAFGLSPISVPREELPGGLYRSARSFYDYVIDAVEMRSMLPSADSGVLGDRWDSTTFARQLIADVAGDSRLGGRTQIYGCGECLDIYCGGIAAVIVRRGDRIEWSRIERFDMQYRDAGEHVVAELAFTTLALGPYEFDFDEYRMSLARFLG